jgi:hypothetical protein
MPLFLDIYFICGYSMGVDEEKYNNLGWGLLVVSSARCRLAVWMHWSCIDVIVVGFKSVEELYPSPP